MSNAHYAFIGDMMIIRAATDIPANTELFFSAMAICACCLTRISRTWGSVALMSTQIVQERRPLEQVLRLGLWEPLIMIAGVYDSLMQQDEARDGCDCTQNSFSAPWQSAHVV
jgi:hypothetical protein